jgi:ribose-phosphate pyrophosphokinase
MRTVVFALPGNENLAAKIAARLDAEIGKTTLRQFPDKETYIRIHSEVKGKRVIMVCTLNNPDEKLLPLYFLSQTAKALGADCTCLVAPYLAYMRQDKQFNPGEGITSTYFAHFISNFADTLITIDPHLHRRHTMSEIYTIPYKVLHAAALLSDWIRDNIEKPVLIGPDSESEQWVEAVAKDANAPFIILEKVRQGDRDVQVSVPHVEKYKEHIPVLVDDIISTAHTMIETIGHLKKAGMKPAVCIGVHGIFAGSAYDELKKAGAGHIVTTNTIAHESNAIEIAHLIASVL